MILEILLLDTSYNLIFTKNSQLKAFNKFKLSNKIKKMNLKSNMNNN